MLGRTLENTPLGCRLVFITCICYYLLYILDHHAFVTLDVVCRPGDVLHHFQIQRLLQASFVHTSFFGLLAALLVCGRRFAWIENRSGTLGFLIWFVWASLILHGSYCIVALLLSPFLGDWILADEVHGLFPLVVASLVSSIKDSDNTTVWLWPLPYHVSVRFFPLFVVLLSWLLHWTTHLDVVTAYFFAGAFPALLEEPSASFLDRAEESSLGRFALSWLQASDSFVFRQPVLAAAFAEEAAWLEANFPEQSASKGSFPSPHRKEVSTQPFLLTTEAVGGGEFPTVFRTPQASALGDGIGAASPAQNFGSPATHSIHDDDDEFAELGPTSQGLEDEYAQSWA